jgi:hypothetical protein
VGAAAVWACRRATRVRKLLFDFREALLARFFITTILVICYLSKRKEKKFYMTENFA